MKQVRMEKWVSTKDSVGDHKETVTQRLNTWAHISRSSGDRSSINGQEGLTNYFIFKILVNNIDPTGNWRLIYDRRLFTVHTIEKEKQSNFYWIIKAEATGQR